MFTLQKYIDLNASFSKNLVFRLGAEAGFFSEVNNMILAMVYCLINKINFSFSSVEGNFLTTNKKNKSAWQNYFEPFLNENLSLFNIRYNLRPFHHARLSSIERIIVIPTLKKIHKIDFFTHDVFDKCRNPKILEHKIYIKELDFEGSFFDLTSNLINNIWNFNITTKESVDEIINSLSLPPKFVGIHLRAGDKIIEHKLIDTQTYINKIQQITTLKDFFVFTDDYKVIQSLKCKTNWNIHTTCLPHEKGYVHQDFLKRSDAEKNRELVKLLASMEVLYRGEFFLGTFTSNPGMFLGMRKANKNVYGVDSDRWLMSWG